MSKLMESMAAEEDFEPNQDSSFSEDEHLPRGGAVERPLTPGEYPHAVWAQACSTGRRRFQGEATWPARGRDRGVGRSGSERTCKGPEQWAPLDRWTASVAWAGQGSGRGLGWGRGSGRGLGWAGGVGRALSRGRSLTLVRRLGFSQRKRMPKGGQGQCGQGF